MTASPAWCWRRSSWLLRHQSRGAAANALAVATGRDCPLLAAMLDRLAGLGPLAGDTWARLDAGMTPGSPGMSWPHAR